MKTIEDRAHEYFLETMRFIRENNIAHDFDEIVKESFDYAEAMQAEAEKRKTTPNADHIRKVREAQWQPDWSQAPDEANTITIDACGVGQYWIMYHQAEPKLGDSRWFDDYKGRYLGGFEPLGFNGDWKDSLRKRP